MENLSTVSVRDSAPELARGAAVGLSMPSQTLVALVSRHVAQDSEYLTVGRTRIGRTDTFTTVEAIDILPVKVFEEYIANCDTTFKSEFGVTMRVAKLTMTNDIQDLVGFPVHIWSDRSVPGLGILVEHELIHRNGIRIIIRDRDEAAPFLHEGDSGAMVCYSDPRRGNTVFAVAMIVGEMTEGNENTREYTAQILDDALQKLGVMNGCRYLFIEEGS
ncbi:hypothetical protein DPMN_134357 [Dreissena polymorpha]|uniref:Uncharacterized protein n=1 Tax=Dreissena polymorpha TaxID=45954 RepID=A0A9D4JFQ9_DREPO|nr:hypothetical protein DPMN_134357 [Dreissena polymorpha]